MLNAYIDYLTEAGPGKCLSLAAASTGIWYLIFMLADGLGADIGPLPSAGIANVFGWLLLWSTGSVYAVLVLFRYAKPDAAWSLGGTAVAGAFSYWIGVQLTLNVELTDQWWSQGAVGGATSGVFVGVVCVWLGRLRPSTRLFGALLASGGIGGGIVGLHADVEEELLSEALFISGHGVWQVLTAAALYSTGARQS